jgi:hypothetical protein
MWRYIIIFAAAAAALIVALMMMMTTTNARASRKNPRRQTRATMAPATPGDWMSFLELADAYRKGSFGEYAPDPATATIMYRLATRASDPEIASAATLRLLECTTTPVPREDARGTRPSVTYAEMAMRDAPDVPDVPDALPEPPLSYEPPLSSAAAAAAAAARASEKLAKRTLVTNDPQNVHDHALLASMRRRISGLDDDDASDTNAGSAYERVVDLVLTRESERAFRMLDSLSDQPHSSLGISEREALELVWPAVVRLGAEDILVSQLESGVERGHVVCSTGKIARILGTLDGLDPEVMRPMWAVREEIRGLAVQTRDSGGGKSAFLERVFSEYVDGLGMDATIVKKMTDDFSCGFDH